MKKMLSFCLFITPAIVSAAANNDTNTSNLQKGQFYLFHGKKALQQGDFERAKTLIQKGVALGYPGAIEALTELEQIFVEQNQMQGHRELIVKRNKQ